MTDKLDMNAQFVYFSDKLPCYNIFTGFTGFPPCLTVPLIIISLFALS